MLPSQKHTHTKNKLRHPYQIVRSDWTGKNALRRLQMDLCVVEITLAIEMNHGELKFGTERLEVVSNGKLYCRFLRLSSD